MQQVTLERLKVEHVGQTAGFRTGLLAGHPAFDESRQATAPGLIATAELMHAQ